ncbi:MAG: 2-hydroxychromene-2-carboxylate isomerase, partial [Pseudomonadota bacterium]
DLCHHRQLGGSTATGGLASIWAYMGHKSIADIARSNNATIAYHPFLIMPMFAGTGGTPPGQRSWQRKQYRMMEIKRWQEYLGMDFNPTPPHFPTDEKLAASITTILKDRGEDISALSWHIMNAMWVEETDMADANILQKLCEKCGFDGASLIKEASSDEAMETIVKATDQAMDAGVYGAPTYIVDGEVFWGQDRLDFVGRKLSKLEE